MTAHWTGCPSRLQLERVLHGELLLDNDADLRGHLAGCDRCSGWLAQAREETERLRTATDSAVFAARVVQRLNRHGERSAADRPSGGAVGRWLATHRAAWVGLAAAGLAGLLLVLTPLDEPPQPRSTDTTRVKGSTFVRLYVKRGDRVRVLEPGDLTEPGDAVRFEVFPGPHRYAMVVSLRSDGEPSIYVPFDGTTSLPVTPHHSLLFDGSIVLEGLAEELLIVLFSDDPIVATRAKATVRSAYRRAKGQLERVHGLELGDATHLWLLRRTGLPP